MAKPSQRAGIKPDAKPAEIPLKFHWPEGNVSRFANQMTVQIGEGVCFLGFYEAMPPIILGTPADVEAQVRKIRSIQADGVARVVIPVSRLQEMINMMQSTLDKSGEVMGGLIAKDEAK